MFEINTLTIQDGIPWELTSIRVEHGEKQDRIIYTWEDYRKLLLSRLITKINDQYYTLISLVTIEFEEPREDIVYRSHEVATP